jgi:D-alanyl-D-alanine dipeptidase
MGSAAAFLTMMALLAAPAPVAIPAETRQLVLVTTGGWDDPAGTLTRWERGPGQPWRRVGEPVAVLVGGGGLAWGRGLHANGDGPVKREGDRRAPAGVFTLGTAFGYAARADDGVRWPYRPLEESSVCVDDPQAAAYNRIVEGPGPWRSAERMRRAGQAYRWGVVIEHNVPALPGAGSCTFVHGFGRKHLPTAGCTALPEGDLRALIAWLRPAAHPVLVQAPGAVYAVVGARWGGPPPS